MTQSNICIRMDENLKKQFDFLCNELGLTMSTAINIFVKKFVRDKALPFALSLNDYNEETRNAIEEVENGIGLSGPFNSVDELFKNIELEKDD